MHNASDVDMRVCLQISYVYRKVGCEREWQCQYNDGRPNVFHLSICLFMCVSLSLVDIFRVDDCDDDDVDDENDDDGDNNNNKRRRCRRNEYKN